MAEMDQPESQSPPSPQGKLERLWSQALLAVSSAGEEAGRAAQALAERAGLNPEEIRRHVRDFTDRLAVQRRDFERGVEEASKKALSTLKVPRREQIQELQNRLDKLERRLGALMAEKR
jgi:polyhydroxyalkanoate synthesis regulator phasin